MLSIRTRSTRSRDGSTPSRGGRPGFRCLPWGVAPPIPWGPTPRRRGSSPTRTRKGRAATALRELGRGAALALAAGALVACPGVTGKGRASLEIEGETGQETPNDLTPAPSGE